jgi:hypothetical protein
MLKLLITILLVAAPSFDVAVSDGPAMQGRLVELSPKQAVVETTTGRANVPTEKLVAIRPAEKSNGENMKPAIWVELTDGSLLAGQEYRVHDRHAEVSLAGGGMARVPTRAVAHVRLQEQSEKQAEQWSEILQADRNGDLIVIKKGDVLDYLTGVLGDVTPETVQFELDGNTVPVKRPKVAGLIYAKPAGELPDSFCTASDLAGSRVQVQSAVIKGDKLNIMTPAGVELSWALVSVSGIRFKVQYLSDLVPESASRTPLVGSLASLSASAKQFFRPRFNAALQNNELQLDRKTYEKGLALYGGTELVYRLPGDFSALKAVAGIDDAVRPEGNVRLQIYGDDRSLLDVTITGHDKPLPIDVDLRGVKRLRIVVDFNGDEVADHLDLCEARIVK